MISKIDITDIVFRHLQTLRNERTKKIDRLDVFLFYTLPALGTITFILLDMKIKYDAISIFVTSFSIFIGFLINVLIFMHGMVDARTKFAANENKKWLFDSTFCNISYAILVSIAAIIILIIMAFMSSASLRYELLSYIFIFLLTNFLLTLLMILKRIHVIFTLPDKT